jgi:hypothetical protein
MTGSILFLASFQTIVKSKYLIIALIVSSARVHRKSHFYFQNIDMGTSVIVERAFKSLSLLRFK